MKVVIGSFTAESNYWNPFEEVLEDFDIAYGEEIADKMFCREIFEKENIEMIPTIFANGGAKGYVNHDDFMFIANKILDGVRQHKDDLDGIFLFLHGASHIKGLDCGVGQDSGEHYILEEIRKMVGDELPIAMIMDPHGNMTQRIAELTNIVRCYRHSPHWDRQDCYQKVAHLFVDLLKNPRPMHPEYIRIPILVGGERCVSADDPMTQINDYIDAIEKEEGIFSVSYHIGYGHADSSLCSAGAVVIPDQSAYQEKARKWVGDIQKFVFERRKLFHFTGYTQEEEKAIEESLETEKNPVFLTDAGDNATAGALAYNTRLLKNYMSRDLKGKKILFASIHDPEAMKKIGDKQVGDQVDFYLGMDIDDYSKPVEIKGHIVAKGDLNSFYAFPHKIGDTLTVSLDGMDIDIIVSNQHTAFREVQQFEAAGLDYKDYQVIIVKQGYLYTEELELAGLAIMALTPGITLQNIEDLPFTQLKRPIYPFEEDFELEGMLP